MMRVKWKKKESKKEIKKEEPVGCLTRVISTNTGHFKVSNLTLLKLNHSPKLSSTIVMFKLT